MKSDLELNQETLRMIADPMTGKDTQIYTLIKEFMKLRFKEFIVQENFIETELADYIRFKIPVVNYLDVFDVPKGVKSKRETGILEVEFRKLLLICLKNM